MRSPESFGMNGMSDLHGGLTKSLLDSASLLTSLDDNSALTDLNRVFRTPVGKDPVSSGLDRLSTLETRAGNNRSNSNQDLLIIHSSAVSNADDPELLFNEPRSLADIPFQPFSSRSTTSDSITGLDPVTGRTSNTPLISISNDPLTGVKVAKSLASSPTTAPATYLMREAVPQTQSPSFAVKAEGTLTINGGGDFDGNPVVPSDDALIYAGRGFTINNNPVLPVQRDANGNPLRDSSGKLLLVDRAVTVAAGYTVSNAPNNQYANLLPPQVVEQQTVTVPAYADVRQQELARRIPPSTATVTFNAQQNPLNSASDWASKFPAPGTAARPTVVRVTNGGLNIPANLTLSNYVITVEGGDINFNGTGHNLNNVVLVTNNGNINLADVRSSDLSVFASGSLNMNGGARFAGSTLLANGSSGGNITFNGATATTNSNDNLRVISQGDITYNSASNTRGEFLSVRNFTFNSNSTVLGAIAAKGNIIFNGRATVIAVAFSSPDNTPPAIAAGLVRDTAPAGSTNTDRVTADPTIAGTVTDASQVTAFRAGFDNTPISSYVNILSQLSASGNFTLNRTQLAQVYGGTLPDGVHTLHLVAQDQYGNLSNVFDVPFTLDTQSVIPTGLNLLAASDSGLFSSDQITNDSTPTIAGSAEAGAIVQLFSSGQLVGQTTATSGGTWLIATSNLADGTYSLTATGTDVAGNISLPSAPRPATAPLNVVVDTLAPVAPTSLRLTAATDSGVSNSDNITNNPVPTLQGNAEAGTLVQLFSDGQLVGQTTATTTNTWLIATSNLADGTHSLTATATDVAGNISPVSAPLNVVVDILAPVAPSGLKLTADTDSGASYSDNITNNTTPTITGNADAGSLVRLFQDRQLIGQTTANPNGSWQLAVGACQVGDE